jgi:hypothetical protein
VLPLFDEETPLAEKKEQFIQRATRQAQLLNHGVSNWESNPRREGSNSIKPD